MELSLLRLAILGCSVLLALFVAFGVGFIAGRDGFSKYDLIPHKQMPLASLKKAKT